jgi:hypothetical protein
MALTEQATAEIQELSWAFADDMISADDAKKLESMLLAEPEARQVYVQCMQLQADLHLFFNPDILQKVDIPGVTSKKSTPVLKNLPKIDSGPNSTNASL